MSRMKLDYRAASVQGFGYASNDDRLLLLEDYGVCAVADGTDGYGRGATLLLDAIRQYIVAHGRPLNLRQLEGAVRAGEDALARAASSDDMLRGSGTTLDIAVFLDDRLLGIHVGDGRIYRLRDGTIEQLSTDHTWVQEQVDAGTLSPADAVSHPLANVITRALPAEHRVKLETITLPLEAGDLIVLCTDGAWSHTANRS